MTLGEIAEAMKSIAHRINHTACLSRRDPSRWYEERDELARELKTLAGRLDGHNGNRSSPRERIRQVRPGVVGRVFETVIIKGHETTVERRFSVKRP